jgi:hypothetical protein
MNLFERWRERHSYKGRHHAGRVSAAPVAPPVLVTRSPLLTKLPALRIATIGERAAMRRQGYRPSALTLVFGVAA